MAVEEDERPRLDGVSVARCTAGKALDRLDGDRGCGLGGARAGLCESHRQLRSPRLCANGWRCQRRGASQCHVIEEAPAINKTAARVAHIILPTGLILS